MLAVNQDGINPEALDVVKALVAGGADPDQINDEGLSAKMMADVNRFRLRPEQ